MKKFDRRRQVVIILILTLIIPQSFSQEGLNNDPCKGPYPVITLTNRGGICESPCAIPYRSAFLEGGYQYQQFPGYNGILEDYPQAEFRLGLPKLNEFFIHIPSYSTQRNSQGNFLGNFQGNLQGSDTTGLGLKHQFSNLIPHFVASLEGVLYLRGGGASFGNKDVGTEATAIFLYDWSSKLSTTFLLKMESISPPPMLLQGRYTNFTSGGILNYSVTKSFILFSQAYGLTKTSPNSSGAINVVFGFFYLLHNKIVLDVEYYRQLTHNLDQYQNSFGFGLSMLL